MPPKPNTVILPIGTVACTYMREELGYSDAMMTIKTYSHGGDKCSVLFDNGGKVVLGRSSEAHPWKVMSYAQPKGKP